MVRVNTTTTRTDSNTRVILTRATGMGKEWQYGQMGIGTRVTLGMGSVMGLGRGGGTVGRMRGMCMRVNI